MEFVTTASTTLTSPSPLTGCPFSWASPFCANVQCFLNGFRRSYDFVKYRSLKEKKKAHVGSLKEGKSVENIHCTLFYIFIHFFEFFYGNWLKGKVIPRKYWEPCRDVRL